MKLKLGDEAPEQKMAVLGIAGVMILISLISSFGGSSGPKTASNVPAVAADGQIVPKYRNPQLSWYEKLFCRGYQKSWFTCSSRMLHPSLEESVEDGDKDGKRGVIRYQGPLPKKSGWSGRVVLDNYD